MKICYTVEGEFILHSAGWQVVRYLVTEPEHESGPPFGEVKTKFAKGDLVDLAFPVGDPAAPLYAKVTAYVTATSPGHGWRVTVYYDAAGVDFGEGYRVLYEAMQDDLTLSEFQIGFVSSVAGPQPWGFTAAADPGQHTELGKTYLCP